MSRNRFNLIGKYFYVNHAKPEDFVNNKLINPLHKVQPLIDVLVKSFADNWVIQKMNCVDEGKIPYKGSFCPVQSYDPDKPYKYGPKLHLANDSLTGYCWGLSCYTGAGHTYAMEPMDWVENFGFGERTVLHFARKMPCGSHLFTDRYYSSPNLAVKLRDEYHVYLTGTMMGNRRGVPWNWFTYWNQADSERGFYRWLYDPNLKVYATIWKDRNVVPMVSTAFGVTPVTIIRGGGGSKTTRFLKSTNVVYGRYNYRAPNMAWPYNKFMGGTDLWDKLRLLQQYSLERHVVNHKWWKKYFWALMDAAIANAFLCWKSVDPKKRSHYDFMELLHDGMVSNKFDTLGSWGLVPLALPKKAKIHVPKTPSKKPAAQSAEELAHTQVLSPTITDHHIHISWKNTAEYQLGVRTKGINPKSKPRKRCMQCKEDGVPDKWSYYVCTGCNNTFLCRGPCFTRWHTRLAKTIKHGLKFK
jgi:hypothetical protein